MDSCISSPFAARTLVRPIRTRSLILLAAMVALPALHLQGEEVTQSRAFSVNKTASGTGTLILLDTDSNGLNGLVGTGLSPFDPSLGTLTSFTINWSTSLTASGTVSPSAQGAGSFNMQIGGNFYLNSAQYSGAGGGGGNGGGPGSVINPVVATAGESKVFQVAGAGTAYNPAILTAVTGSSDFSLSYIGGTITSPGNFANITYSGLSNLNSLLEGSVTLTYTYTPPLSYRGVETFAGSGTAGAADATGTAATYNGPWGISTDALGNFYHADYTGKRIRRTTPAGVVTFIDSFSSFPPIATAIDPATGSLYVAIETHRILRYVNKNAANYPAQAPVYGPETDFPDATIVYAGASTSGATNASGTSARFNAPHGLHVRGGILYVADKGNNLIRKINLSNAAVTTVTVTGGTLSAPEAVWVAEDGTIYVACTGSDLIQKIAPGGALSTVAGSVAGNADGSGTAASFNDPRGLAMNGRGELLVADSGNHSIRRISPNGAVRTIAGGSASGAFADGAGATARFSSPRGVVFGADGLLYITDHGNHRIRRMNVLQPLITGAPASLAAFTADYGNSSAVQSFALAGTLLEGPITITAPSGFEVSTDGSSYAASVTSNEGATLSVRLAATAASGSLTGNLTLASAQADTINIALSGQVAVVLHPSVGTLSGFSSTVGGTSAAQSFSLSGGGLRDLVKVTAPAGYEISTDGLNFASAATLGRPGGTIQSVLLDAAGQNSIATGALHLTGSGNQFPNDGAFAALKSDGSVVAWGNSFTGGDSSSVAASLSSGVTAIYSNKGAFAAVKRDGSVVTWGNTDYGGDSSVLVPGQMFGSPTSYTPIATNLTSNVKAVYSTGSAFAALKIDGSVVTWGGSGGDSSSVANSLSSGVTAVYSTGAAFAALKNDGSLITWGSSNGGDSSSVANSLRSGVTAVYSTGYAFAALKNNGSLITWGGSSFGGNFGGNSSSVASSLSSGVTAVYSNPYAFAALKNDGSVITWGGSSTGGNSSGVANSLSSGVTAIFSGAYAFAALKNDGSVVTWGEGNFGGNSSSVANSLSSGVVNVYSTQQAFAALKNDGSLITWGEALYGGSGGPANIGGGVPPTLPLTLHVRLAATASLGAVAGNLTISATGATTKTVALSGTVTDEPTYTHQELWRFANFGSYTSANSGADSADPDHDGLSNLLEYALGLDPNSSGVIPAVLALNGANLEYTYTRSTAAKDNGVTYQIEWSDTLEAGSWSTETVTQQITSTQGALETVKASVPKGTGGKRFLRLRVGAPVGGQ